MEAIPSPAEVERIAAIRDPVQRNLQITQTYRELSSALSTALGPLCGRSAAP